VLGVWLITQVPEQVFAVGLVGKAAALVATVSQYCAAPGTWLQLKVGVVDTPDCPLEGFDKVGAESVAACVVNVHWPEYGPTMSVAPELLKACTSQ
jgi:hypothetical protein